MVHLLAAWILNCLYRRDGACCCIYCQEPLLPLATNISPVHLPREDVAHFIQLQQRLESQLGVTMALLEGMFVLVPSSSLQQQQQQ
jgi:hypothetical protein